MRYINEIHDQYLAYQTEESAIAYSLSVNEEFDRPYFNLPYEIFRGRLNSYRWLGGYPVGNLNENPYTKPTKENKPVRPTDEELRETLTEMLEMGKSHIKIAEEYRMPNMRAGLLNRANRRIACAEYYLTKLDAGLLVEPPKETIEV